MLATFWMIVKCVLAFFLARTVSYYLMIFVVASANIDLTTAVTYFLTFAPSFIGVIAAYVIYKFTAKPKEDKDESDRPVDTEAEINALMDKENSIFTVIQEEISCWNWQLVVGGLIFCWGLGNLFSSFFFAIVLIVLGLGLLSVGHTKYEEKQELLERKLKRKILAMMDKDETTKQPIYQESNTSTADTESADTHPLLHTDKPPQVKTTMKKPFYKRWWFGILILLVLLGSCSTPAATENSATNTSSPLPVTSESEAETTLETTEQTEAVIATIPVETTMVAEEATIPPLSIEDAVIALDLILPEGFENYSISHDGNLITIGVWEKGVVDVIDEISSGRIEYKLHWDALVDSYISTNNSYCKLVKDMGIEDISISLNLLNDYDRTTVLLSVIDGAVEYDCLADLPIPEMEETLSARDQLDSIMATYNPTDIEQEWNYVLNTNTMKFHYTDCSSVSDIKPGNRRDVTAIRAEVVAKGYEACKRCSP